MLLPRHLLKVRQFAHLLCQNSCSKTCTRKLHPAPALFAGHSKWANIRHIKAAKDGEKAAAFTRLSRQIRLAIQEGGSIDPNLNSQLRSVMEEALRKNMPMATIQNNIKKSQQSKAHLKKYRLEMRYKQKVFAICVLYTDNFPALKMDLAPILKKAGATFTDAGHMFDDFGLIEAVTESQPALTLEERATEDAIECGAEEVEVVDPASGSVNFICSPTHLDAVRRVIERKGYSIQNTEHIYSPKNYVQLLPDEQKAYDVFVQKLRDVQGLEDIYDNVQIGEN